MAVSLNGVLAPVVWLSALFAAGRGPQSLAEGKQSGQGSTSEESFSFPVLWNEETITRRSVSYADGATNLTGYLSYYPSSEKKAVVMVIPDADGIGPYEKWRADLFAAMGYIGFVADLYGRGVKQGPQMPPEQRSTLVKQFLGNEQQFRGRLVTNLNVVRSLTIAAPGRIAAVGWGFGGAGAMQLLRAWPDSDGISGVASFYGAPLWNKNFGPIVSGVPIRVAIYNGAMDATNKPDALLNFRGELDAANVTWQWTDFSPAVSGFSQPDRPELVSADQLIAYSPTADAMSWFALRGFLLYLFGYTNPANLYTAANMQTDYSTGFVSYMPVAPDGTALEGSPAAAPEGPLAPLKPLTPQAQIVPPNVNGTTQPLGIAFGPMAASAPRGPAVSVLASPPLSADPLPPVAVSPAGPLTAPSVPQVLKPAGV